MEALNWKNFFHAPIPQHCELVQLVLPDLHPWGSVLSQPLNVPSPSAHLQNCSIAAVPLLTLKDVFPGMCCWKS